MFRDYLIILKKSGILAKVIFVPNVNNAISLIYIVKKYDWAKNGFLRIPHLYVFSIRNMVSIFILCLRSTK